MTLLGEDGFFVSHGGVGLGEDWWVVLREEKVVREGNEGFLG